MPWISYIVRAFWCTNLPRHTLHYRHSACHTVGKFFEKNKKGLKF